MSSDRRQFLRDNAFLLAAVALPVAVAVFFLLATAIPNWTVPPPAFDFVLRAHRPWEGRRLNISVEVGVRNGRVEATVRRTRKGDYEEQWGLFLFEHATGTVREIPIEIPEDLDKDEPSTVAIPELDGRQVMAGSKAPDGYELSLRTRGGGGLVGELFGMGRYDSSATLVNRGRVVPLRLPPPYERVYGQVVGVGWIVDAPRRSASAAMQGSH